jgi:hypothetical protein
MDQILGSRPVLGGETDGVAIFDSISAAIWRQSVPGTLPRPRGYVLVHGSAIVEAASRRFCAAQRAAQRPEERGGTPRLLTRERLPGLLTSSRRMRDAAIVVREVRPSTSPQSGETPLLRSASEHLRHGQAELRYPEAWADQFFKMGCMLGWQLYCHPRETPPIQGAAVQLPPQRCGKLIGPDPEPRQS